MLMAEPADQTHQFVKPPRFELRLSLLFAAIFVAPGVHLPYFPLWLNSLGLDSTQIALVLSAPLFLRLLTTPLITALADRVADRAHVLIAMTGASLFLSLGYLLEPAYLPVLGISVLLQIVWTPHAPLVDSLVISGVRRFGTDYPTIRKWGSFAFLTSNLAGGAILGWAGAGAVPVLIVFGLAVAFLMSMAAPRLGRPRRASPLSAAGMRTAPSLLAPGLLLFVAGAGIINSSHGFLYSFGSIYWSQSGVGETAIGLLWGWAVVAEIALMMVFTRLFGRFSARSVLMLAGLAAAVRWGAMPLVVPLDGGLFAFFALQSLHSLSTGLILIGVPKMIAATVGEDQMGAAQGVVFLGNGLAMASITLASGPLYERVGPGGFHVMAATAIAGLVLVAVSGRFSPKAGRSAER